MVIPTIFLYPKYSHYHDLSFDDLLNNNPYGLYLGAITFIILGIIKFIQDTRKDKKTKLQRQDDDDTYRYIEKVKSEVCDDLERLYARTAKAAEKEELKAINHRLNNMSDRLSRLEGSFDTYFNRYYRPKTKHGLGPLDYDGGEQ